MSDSENLGNTAEEPSVHASAEVLPSPSHDHLGGASEAVSKRTGIAPALFGDADASPFQRLIIPSLSGPASEGAAVVKRRSGRLRRVRRAVRLPRTYLTSLAKSATSANTFEEVETYCLFIGYSRSGHSLLGSLVDAHPDAVIAHELDAIRLFHLGFTRKQVYLLILEKERQFALGGSRAKDDHDYAVPNQWQGRYRQLRVIGNKKGALSTRRLGTYPALLDRIRSTVGTRLRVIHVVRNPYDNIASMYRRKVGRSTLEQRVEYYFSLCRSVAELKQRLQPAEVIDVRHEDIVSNPRTSLIRIGAFLSLEMTDNYIKDCASVLFPAPRRTRDGPPWNDSLLERVSQEAACFNFLQGYTFDS